MARRKFKENLGHGILTPANLAALLSVSTPKVHRILDRGYILCRTAPDSKDRVISAISALRFFMRMVYAVPDDLFNSAVNFITYYKEDFSLRSTPLKPNIAAAFITAVVARDKEPSLEDEAA